MTGDLQINGKRLLADLAELSRVGATPEGGVDRPALSEADLVARRWFRARAEEAGLVVHLDGAANLSAVFPSDNPSAQTVMCGSHLDSVPNGGRFDGSLGVVAALEVLRTAKENSLRLPVHLEAIDFTDEEGTWIPIFGSQALAGTLNEADFDITRSAGSQGVFHERLQAAGITPASALGAARKPETIKAWVEVHIEQGSRLEESGTPVGVVTAIVGITSLWLKFLGRADHAGTAPMDRRQDALRGVAEFIRQSRELVTNRFPMGVMNCGNVHVEPGAFNIVPASARLALEFRHPDMGKLEAMREALVNLALHVVEVEGLALEVEPVGIYPPSPMHRDVIAAIERSCEQLRLASVRMPSYAGHDTMVMSGLTRSGMFFVPSLGGHSHSAREYTSDEDCVTAGNILLHTVLQLAAG